MKQQILLIGTFLLSYLTLAELKPKKSPQIIPDKVVTKTINNPDSLLINTINQEFNNLTPMSKGWSDLFSVKDSIRVVFDINTFEIVDTIKDTRRARKKYFRLLPKKVYEVRKSFLGRKSKIKEAFHLYDKYANIIRDPIKENNLPLILSYIPVIETHMTPVTSRAKAVGYWQLKKGSSGDLTINRYVDERKSIVKSSERAADYLEGLYSVFPEWKLAATAYIRGPAGQARDLEEMLDLKKPGKVFDSYSDMVSFHQKTDFKIYDYKTFSSRIKKNKPSLWNKTYNHFRKIKGDRKENTNFKLYLDYLSDFSGKSVSSVLFGESAYKDYILNDYSKNIDSTLISFFDYYNLKEKDIYLDYHKYLKGTNNKFYSPQYVPEIVALAWMHNNGFEYEKAQPISIEEIELKSKQVKKFVQDPEIRELNSHLKNRAISRDYVPKGTIGYTIVE